MNPIGTKTIHTKRLILRPFQVEDAREIFENWASDSEVTYYLTWLPHESVETTKESLKRWVDDYQNPLQFKWAIVFNEEVVGNIDTVHVKEKIDAVEIGYVLSRKCWGKGIMTEALVAVSRYLLEEAGCNRFFARHDVNNPASGKVMQKAGMTYEGTLRRIGKNNQGICDMAYYSIIKADLLKEEEKIDVPDL